MTLAWSVVSSRAVPLLLIESVAGVVGRDPSVRAIVRACRSLRSAWKVVTAQHGSPVKMGDGRDTPRSFRDGKS